MVNLFWTKAGVTSTLNFGKKLFSTSQI